MPSIDVYSVAENFEYLVVFVVTVVGITQFKMVEKTSAGKKFGTIGFS
ncbi:hypothetical protein [Acinetobacter bereziniae]|jgi:hypothetical protein|nr:hypothetical protein TOL5_37550 [Acinetobacter sp. Tol 5]CEI51790.1 hypothetical protein [Acinetobacter bereziniae]